MDIFHVFRLLGGLAMFLFGMDTMSKSLQKQAGGKLQKILGAFTGNPLKGFLLGMAVTAVIQSSGATTVMVVGFVNSGVMTLQKPTNPAIFSSTLRLLCATRERLRRMEQKTATLEEKMEEIRLVNRAKWILIDQLKMTENEAHKFIERQAMDRCVTRRTIAENILATYK